jgi:spermidine synthase
LSHRPSLTLGIFALTLLLSALLLFLVQPMIGKMLLPQLGGTPAVWNTCMVFFQATLLAGYLYVHITATALGRRSQIILHAGFLILPLLCLPITLDQSWFYTSGGNPVLRLLAVLLVSAGLPFFVVSTTAPLLQQWFASSGHPAAHDPYFLYSASNLGSMVALLGYPWLIEPYLRLGDQSRLWTTGYVILIVLISVCAVLTWRSSTGAPADQTPASAGPPAEPPPGTLPPRQVPQGQRWRWVVLAFVPSSLMLGVTTYITNDIAAIPLLWVIPLALYLLSFMLVFARLPQRLHTAMVLAAPVVTLTLLFLMTSKITPLFGGYWTIILLHLIGLFVIAMLCHGALASTRPPTQHLTAFYLYMSLGGVLGGLFNAAVAPLLFTTWVEYPYALILGCFLLPRRGRTRKRWSRWLDVGIPLGLALLTVGLVAEWLVIRTYPERLSLLLNFESNQLHDAAQRWLKFDLDKLNPVLKFGLPLVLCYGCVERPMRFGLSVGAIVLAALGAAEVGSTVLYRERSFFGVLQVEHNRPYYSLVHGTTLHGMQSQEPDRRQEPLTYYHRSGPVGHVFEAFAGDQLLQHIAIVGLGTGTLASYGEAGQKLTFYEIDPAVLRLVSEARYFTYVQDARQRGVEVTVVLGDARLKLAEAAPQQYGLIILDAFSSDAIPVHLMTREAIELYFTRLVPGGLVALHISNRYLDLAPVLGNLAQAVGLVGFKQSNASDDTIGKSGSQWVVLARQRADVQKLVEGARPWEPLADQPEVGIWSDNFSNILRILRWKR